jgi:microcystin synthetase protein McyG
VIPLRSRVCIKILLRLAYRIPRFRKPSPRRSNGFPKGRIARILEIGAGTGGTTTYVLPRLQADRTNYTFTDVSPLFTERAREKFQSFSFVDYQTLDIERNPATQRFDAHSYDIVLAANVLHATTDLHLTLKHVRELLAPQGLLILLEVTVSQRWLDLIFGLTEGWWRFKDLDLRPKHPLLSVQRWQGVLEECGFEGTAAIGAGEAGQDAAGKASSFLRQIRTLQPNATVNRNLG